MPRFRGLLLLVSVCITNGLMAQQKLSLYVAPGYQVANSRWSIAGNSNGANPNIYSELIWKNLQCANVQAGIGYQYKQWGVRFNYNGSFIQSGDVTDTDYGADNRRQPVYEGVFQDDKGYLLNIDAAITYTFHLHGVDLTPMLGYVLSKQNLYVLPKQASDPANLRSTYNAKWQGLLTGVEAVFPLGKRFALTPSLYYYQLHYTADANWNLITQFQHPRSFAHKANGYALKPALRLDYKLHSYLSIFLKGDYAYWNTGKGTDELFLTSGQVDYTQMNGARHQEGGVALGVAFSFKTGR